MIYEPIYDVESLEDEVRHLQGMKEKVSLEGEEIQKRIAELEAKCNAARSDFEIAGTVDLVRFFVNEGPGGAGGEASILSGESQNNVQPITDKKFLEADLKLEILILNDLMTKGLPKMEEEALELERRLGKLKDERAEAEKSEQGIPLHMMKSADELRKEKDNIVDRRMRLNADMRTDVDALLNKKVKLKAEISRLRARLAVVADEEWAIRNGVSKMRMALAASDGTVKVLMSRHRELRRKHFSNSGNGGDNENQGYGWAHYAFEQQCVVLPDSGLAVVLFADLPRAILPWVASSPGLVRQLGGAEGKIDASAVSSLTREMLDMSGTALEESMESVASRGAENLLMKFLRTLPPGSVDVGAKGFDKEQFTSLCAWLEDVEEEEEEEIM